MSSVYDRLTAAESYLRNRLLRLVAVAPGQRAFDLGAGTGAALPTLGAPAGPDGLVVGLDLPREMLRRAADRIARAPGAPSPACASRRFESPLLIGLVST
jgi:ubiquinone/menaquinone biosynthesis C-methylase UbiE